MSKEGSTGRKSNLKSFRGTSVKDNRRKSSKFMGTQQVYSLRVMYEGMDVTPKPLIPVPAKVGDRYGQYGSYDNASNPASISPQKTGSLFRTMSTSKYREGVKTMLRSATLYGKSGFDSIHDDDALSAEDKTSESHSIFAEEEQIEIVTEMPSVVTVKLVETDTFIIFEFNSTTTEKGTPEGDIAEKDNAVYDYLTVGKGRNRKTSSTDAQTVPMVYKTRSTQKDRVKKKTGDIYVTNYVMYDTFQDEIEQDQEKESESSGSFDEFKPNVSTVIPLSKQMKKLMKNPTFLEATMVMERLLANNNYNNEQKRYKGLSDPDPTRLDTEYTYKLRLLFTFQTGATEGKSVTCLRWNPGNPDLLAAGYGKFFFRQNVVGVVAIWNAKNPVQPERVYEFEDSVSSLAFSEMYPSLLAVGLYTGFIKVIDITSRKLRCIIQTTKDSFPVFEALWQLDIESDDGIHEYIISYGQDGKICKTGPIGSRTLISTQIMRVVKDEGILKGIKVLRKCGNPGVQISRYPGVLRAARHPTLSYIYFVATTDGAVHKCSKHYFHQHLSAFLAHEGSIYQLQLSPHCQKIFLTCGDDWFIRIWAFGLETPLFELKVDMQTVQYAEWSPSHSTILASISGSDIHLWDLQRKTYTSQSTTKSPTNARNTILTFTTDGRCIAVGDINGNINVFSLDDIPIAPFFQADLLTQCIKRSLVSKPEILHELAKLGNLYVTENDMGKEITDM